MITRVLTRERFSVETARDGAEAIDLIDGNRFDAILLDLMMPKIDGYGVIDYLRRTAPRQRWRSVIVLTAAASWDPGKLEDRLVFRVVRKPFELGDLVSAVTQCVAVCAGESCESTG